MNSAAKVKHFYLTFSRPSLEHGPFWTEISPEASAVMRGRRQAAAEATQKPSALQVQVGSVIGQEGRVWPGLPVETLR